MAKCRVVSKQTRELIIMFQCLAEDDNEVFWEVLGDGNCRWIIKIMGRVWHDTYSPQGKNTLDDI